MLKEVIKEDVLKFPLRITGAQAGSTMQVKSPFDGRLIAEVELADENAINRALDISCRAFTEVMKKMPAYKRAEILAKTAEILGQRKDEFAETIALEGGKPIKDARTEVLRAINTFSIASREALNISGEQIPMDLLAGNDNRLGIVLREPVGVIAAITPFNFPLNLVAHKLAPALAAGNTVVLKPASSTPVASFKLAQALKDAGLPDGVLQIVPCRGAQGNALVKDKRVALVSFTGSPEVGWKMRGEVHAGTRIALELGGNAALIVHEDADLEAAAAASCRGGYGHAGQTCISVQRVYVQKNIYDKFVKIYKDKVGALKVGDPLDDTTDMGPMIDASAVKKTEEMVADAVKSGARVICGGEAAKANLLKPVILENATHQMTVVCQEVFGPVTALMKYDTIDDAISAVNDSDFGLQAGVFTKNVDIAFKAARGIDVGGVIVNDAPTYRADHMPYGGRKESGAGLEGVKYAIHEMTQPKFICLNLAP